MQAFDWQAGLGGAIATLASLPFEEAGALPGEARTDVTRRVEDGETPGSPDAGAAPGLEPESELQARAAAIEREAFAQGYAAGERSGAEAGAQRAEALVRRLSASLDDLANVRRDIALQAEHDLVRLALAVARRIVQREIQLDHQLVAALAHVALERLDAGRGPALVKMHPEDIERVGAGTRAEWERSAIRLLPDASIPRGGCVVEAPHGKVDATLDSQFAEIAHALLGDDHASPAHVRPAA